jgi:endonuclease YncB( thermonuclease family)
MLKALCIWVGLCGPPVPVHGDAWAIDGDTIAIMGVHVRLWGIDAEELGEPHGLPAKYSLQGLINQGITCNLTGEVTYNRVVGTCYTANGMDIGAEMVKMGQALDCAHYSHGQYKPLEPKDIRKKLIQKPYC